MNIKETIKAMAPTGRLSQEMIFFRRLLKSMAKAIIEIIGAVVFALLVFITPSASLRMQTLASRLWPRLTLYWRLLAFTVSSVAYCKCEVNLSESSP